MTASMSRLFTAIAAGELAKVDRLLADGANPNIAEPISHPRYYGTLELTPLGWAAFKADALAGDTGKQIVDRLLQAGGNPRAGAPVVLASKPDVIERLVGAGAEPDATLSVGDAKEIGASALMFRAEAHDIESIRLLLTLGANAARKDAGGRTALDYAVLGPIWPRPVQITRTEQVDARIAAIEALGFAAPDSAAFSRAMGAVAALEILDKRTEIITGPDGKPVERTIYSRTQTSLRPILEKLEFYGGNPADVVEGGAGSPRRNILMLMLDNYGYRFEPFDEILWLLRRYGFLLLEQADSKGQSALHYIFRTTGLQELPTPETTRLVRALLSFQANPNFRDNSGGSPLHEIARRACRKQGEASPYPFPCDRGPGGGQRPACTECLESARAIIAAGGDPRLADFSGLTPGQEARRRPNCPLTAVFPAVSDADDAHHADAF